MIIQVDTREKQNKEVIRAFNNLRIKWFASKLYAGDYYDFQEPRFVIDLKKDLLEVANNLTSDHIRFKNEIDRALNEMGCPMVVLIREPLDSIEQVKGWSNDKTKVTGETLYKIMMTMSKRYGIKWLFCDREIAGYVIISLLKKRFEDIEQI